MLLTIIAIVCIGCIALFMRRKFSKKGLVFLLCFVVLLVLRGINVESQIREIPISKETLEKVASITWNDEKELLRMGFECSDFGYTAHYYGQDFMCTITLTEALPTVSSKMYKDVYYKTESRGLGFIDWQRLFVSPIPIYRRYIFYTDGMKITAREDNYENTSNAFEDYILSL